MLHEKLSGKIIKAYYEVYNELGYGFLEKVYENAFVLVLKSYGIHGRRQMPINVYFREEQIGSYFADIVIENKIILELKAASSLREEHDIQLMNYLRATNIELGFLFNFGTKPEFKRRVFENKYKNPSESVSSVQSVYL